MAGIVIYNNKKRISLENEFAARTLEIGGNWTRIRLGVLARLNHPSPRDITAGYQFAMGLCSGITNPYGTPTPDHVFGVRSSVGTWTHYATEDRWLTAVGFFKFESGTRTDFGGNVSKGSLTGYVNYLSAWFLELEKDGTTLWLRAGVPAGATNASGANQNTTEVDFMDTVQGDPLSTALTTSPNDYDYEEESQTGFDEVTHGQLDTVNLHWGFSGSKIEYERIAVAKFS